MQLTPIEATSDAVVLDHNRDDLLTDFGKYTLQDRYMLDHETYQSMFARVATAFADDAAHAQRLYDYISNLWFMPATPVLSNGGLSRGLPISCYLNDVEDNLQGIENTWTENIALATNGGGIGTFWGGVRSIGEKTKAGQTSGIIPFIRVMDSLTLAISQGSLRRGSAAVYIDVSHPEIEEFLEIRKPSGDFNRKALNLHHGITIDDAFMQAVAAGTDYQLISPKTKAAIKSVDARSLWQKILDVRIQTGEPYLIFSDNVNNQVPEFQRLLGYKVRQSNLCSEIMLHTGKDYNDAERTAVCCLSSVNAEKFLEWQTHPTFIEDVMRFLDNVLQDFINRAPSYSPRFAKAVYAASQERSVGLGLMGFHSFLQSQKVPFESVMAKSWNNRLFKHLRKQADAASQKLAQERGPCPDWIEANNRGYTGPAERFTHKLAIAPTASISIICGGTSAGIEPIPANIYNAKTLSGTKAVKNKFLSAIISKEATRRFNGDAALRGRWEEAQWDSIVANEGSVQHLDWLSQEDKDVFKTAFELDQRWVIEMAADRTVSVDQATSVNVFLPGDVNKWDLHMLHWTAWERGCKSLYYLRSKSIQRAAHAGADDAEVLTTGFAMPQTDYEECLVCQ